MFKRLSDAWLRTWRRHALALIEFRRIDLSRYIDSEFSSTVRYGPFRGMRFCAEASWGFADRAGMLFGLYEKEVLDALVSVGKRAHLVNLGAGDGYYSVGALVSGLCERSYCYEAGVRSRRIIEMTARENGVLDNIHVSGKAGRGFHREIPASVLEDCTLFVDVEGAEFELLDEEAFVAFRSAVIFVELHDWFFDDAARRTQALLCSAERTHTASFLTMGSRDLSIFPELAAFRDSDRWLLCSEGRGRLMRWVRFDPIPVV
jgi:hypothetical protein